MKVDDFFEKFQGYSFSYDDLIFFPEYVEFALENVGLTTRLTREICLNIPIVSSPMDTVTEASLAIAIALEGGIGLIHYNLSPEDQLREAEKVKRFKNGFITEPVTLSPQHKIRDVIGIKQETGYSIVPITHDGTPHGKLIGMITKYDYSAYSDLDLEKSVKERMVYVENLAIATVEEVSDQNLGMVDLSIANEKLLNSHMAALPIVDQEGYLRYLVTRSDLEKRQNFPNASVDASKGLLVGAAVETATKSAYDRISCIADCVDVVVFDTSQGFCKYELDLIRWVKREYPQLQVIGGNVVTAEACSALIAAGVDGIRVGMGCGSICTTQEVGGIGRGQASSVYACAKECREAKVPLLADGGIKSSADILKALAVGASTVMLGSLLACTHEAPGKKQIRNGILLKEYRGMGSLKAMERGSSVRYGVDQCNIRVPEGVSGYVPSRGSVSDWVGCLMQGLRQGFHKMGMQSIRNLHDRLHSNNLELERRTEAAKIEGNIHSLYEVASEFNVSSHDRSTKKKYQQNLQTTLSTL